MKTLLNDKFQFILNDSGKGISLIHPKLPFVNWIEGKENWGETIVPEGVEARILRDFNDKGNIVETYIFRNKGKFPVTFNSENTGIYTTFNDNYENTSDCLKYKCHTHICCNKEASYVMCLQMGGSDINLGLRLIKGSIKSYSVKRNLKEESNDRGDFILHPELPLLNPGEECEIAWELFFFKDKNDFTEELLKRENFPVFSSEKYLYFENEEISFDIKIRGRVENDNTKIRMDSRLLSFRSVYRDGVTEISSSFLPERTGEFPVEITVNNKSFTATFYVKPDLEKLAEKRIKFITEKQQYKGEGHLNGAYLVYDNEEEKIHYSHLHDHNGGRERMGMAILTARYLQNTSNSEIMDSLNKYVEYFYRELYDEESGTVFNDVMRNQDWHRLYNYPWAALLQIELYRLFDNPKYLIDSYKTMMKYYSERGKYFYGIAIPLKEICTYLQAEGYNEEREIILKNFIEHGEVIMENSINYPPFEVRFEQSIVAPAVDFLFQLYAVTKDKRYFDEAEKQLKLLELFNGFQCNYNQYEVSIRHWDGKWFGKRELYGDTYPHYWSSLTGIAYMDYGMLSNNSLYKIKAQASLRASLSLIGDEGRASCAMVYPESVNGKKAHFYDPYANDQDWALYFALKYLGLREEENE